MNSTQSTPASAVAALQQEIRTRTEVIRTLADLREQLDADRICGAWLSAENNLSASIRRIGEGMWRILVFDHALCYKRLVQDGIIALRRHRLWLGADDGNRVIYDASTETLTIGCYGRFVPEDCIRRQEDDAISAEACDFNEPPNNGASFGISGLPLLAGAALRRTPPTIIRPQIRRLWNGKIGLHGYSAASRTGKGSIEVPSLPVMQRTCFGNGI